MTQYLILHKVRGEPSFDCAEQMEVDGETWWVTNSGYRAYPFLKWSLMDIPEVQTVELLANGLPDDWPDHFEVSGEIVRPKIDVSALLRKFAPKVHRRF
jgi:hypothetical protein